MNLALQEPEGCAASEKRTGGHMVTMACLEHSLPESSWASYDVTFPINWKEHQENIRISTFHLQ